MKVAVIGCGTIANHAHIPAYLKNPETEILYFCDILPERADAAAKKYGCGTAVTDYRTILHDPDIQAVSVCTPNKCHSEIACDFLRAGKHVLCEKPAGIDYAAAKAMQQAQHETGKVLNIGVCNRYNASVGLIKKYIDSGELGQVHHVYVSFRSFRSIPGLGGDFTTKAMAGGGALIDWGVHFFDIVMYCCSDPRVLTVSGEIFAKLGGAGYVYRDMWAGPPQENGTCDVEDSVTGLIRTEGPTISFNGAWAQNIDEEELFIDFMGNQGGIRLQCGQDFTFYTTRYGALVKEKPEFKPNNMYEAEIDAFVRCIRTGEKQPNHIDVFLRTQKLLEDIYRSAALHREIAAETEEAP